MMARDILLTEQYMQDTLGSDWLGKRYIFFCSLEEDAESSVYRKIYDYFSKEKMFQNINNIDPLQNFENLMNTFYQFLISTAAHARQSELAYLQKNIQPIKDYMASTKLHIPAVEQAINELEAGIKGQAPINYPAIMVVFGALRKDMRAVFHELKLFKHHLTKQEHMQLKIPDEVLKQVGNDQKAAKEMAIKQLADISRSGNYAAYRDKFLELGYTAFDHTINEAQAKDVNSAFIELTKSRDFVQKVATAISATLNSSSPINPSLIETVAKRGILDWFGTGRNTFTKKTFKTWVSKMQKSDYLSQLMEGTDYEQVVNSKNKSVQSSLAQLAFTHSKKIADYLNHLTD